jgi:eukaryotic-like serine/threonine-protein kinase
VSEPSCEYDPIDDLADDFLERYRRGERPSLGEYTDRHPELAERIRAVFPALVVMETFGAGGKPRDGPRCGAVWLGCANGSAPG